MSTQSITRDERTVAVENSSYRWAYVVLSFGLLLSTAYRAFERNEPAWDLLGLVVLGGAVVTIYQANHRVLTRRWAGVTALAVVIAIVLGFTLAMMRLR